MQECVSEFISFVTSEAAESAANERRKLLAGEDILGACTRLGLDSYAEVRRRCFIALIVSCCKSISPSIAYRSSRRVRAHRLLKRLIAQDRHGRSAPRRNQNRDSLARSSSYALCTL